MQDVTILINMHRIFNCVYDYFSDFFQVKRVLVVSPFRYQKISRAG